MTLHEWIYQREIRGQVTFSANEVYSMPDMSASTAKTELARMVVRGRVQNVYKGFYVIIPPQYALKGIVPATYYIDSLMQYLNKPYYVALLSAAALHGATHQRAMLTQVMTVSPRPNISEKNGQIDWSFRKDVPESLLLSANSEMGIIRYSNPELTAVDLIQYAKHIGGYQRAATVLAELADEVDMGKINDVLPYTSSAVVQRLGYVLEHVLFEQEKADKLYSVVCQDKRKWHLVLMSNEHPKDESAETNRWRVNMNINIEIDDL